MPPGLWKSISLEGVFIRLLSCIAVGIHLLIEVDILISFAACASCPGVGFRSTFLQEMVHKATMTRSTAVTQRPLVLCDDDNPAMYSIRLSAMRFTLSSRLAAGGFGRR